METTEGDDMTSIKVISKSTAVIACTAMSLLYVSVFHSPTFVFRFPPPTSFRQFLIRRFICAAISTILCLFVSSLLLVPVQSWKISFLLNLYGIQADHVWCAAAFPFLLTCLMYAGSLVVKCLLLLDSWNRDGNESTLLHRLQNLFCNFYCTVTSVASNIAAWRNLVVVNGHWMYHEYIANMLDSIHQLVPMAFMIPLLLCGGFKAQVVFFICPIFFSLAHLNHLLEFYSQQNYSRQKTAMAIGFQLAYTMIFGSYASFLFIRTGHLTAPLVAHTVCNFMGLPAVYASNKGAVVSLAFIAGTIAFIRLLFTLTNPALYNNRIDDCHCWRGYCSWS